MVTNFFKITFSFEEFDIQRTPYSDATLRSLRGHHNAEASFFRHGEHIYISPKLGSQLSLGEVVRLKMADNVEIVEQLVRHLIFRTFRDAFPDRLPEDFAPLRFPSTRPEHDPLQALLPEKLRGIIQFPRVNEVHLRSILHEGQPLLGLLILNQHRWRFPVSLATLHQEGFPLERCTVLETVPVPGLKGVLAPDESVLGEIERLDGDRAFVRTNDGTETRPLAELYLQRTRLQVGRYLEFHLGAGRANEVFRRLREHEQEQASGGAQYREVVRVAEWFARQRYENADGFTFTVTNDAKLAGPSMRLEPTKLVFDYGPGASAPRPLGGLVSFGPFDSSRFDRKRPRLLAMFQGRNRGAATQFLAQLIDGIPSSAYFKKGFRELFRLHEVDYVFKEIGSSSPEDYERAIDEAVKEAGANRFDLALVECPDESRAIPVGKNPYFRAKARLMSYGIPVQCVRDEHLRRDSSALAWSLGPAALQMYAKMGGVPWLLPGSQSVDAELIVGIGNSIHRPNLWSGAEQSRVVGLTTFFLGDGRYIMGQELRSVPFAEYFAELLRSLEESIDFVSKEYAWKEGKTVRLVFHVFKPLKNLEADVIEQLVQRFSRFKIIYAFVTISKFHPWMMYQDAVKENSFWRLTLCERGANLILDHHACLLQLRGDKDRPNKKHRPPHPVLVRIHEKSTYKDQPFIAQQVLDFSYLCWRSFFPTDLPVTIYYAGLMAGLSTKLQRVKGWNPVLLDQHFRRKAWFL